MRLKSTFLVIIILLGTLRVSAQEFVSKKEKKSKDTTTVNDTPPALGTIFKPTIGLGAGTLSYFGNIYSKGHQLQALAQSRFGYSLNLSQPLTDYLHLNFYVMFGQLGANERSSIPDQNKNFQSQIRLGGVQLMYDFSNFIKKKCMVRPYILTGIEGFEFLSKTDLYDKHGNKYYYWNDGSIRNMAQGSTGSQNAQTLVRDYSYDSDIREMNANGYGKYRENSWAIPVGVGFTMAAGEHISFRMGATMHFAFTNHVDGVGSKTDDKFLGFMASVHYDLFTKKKEVGDTLPSNHYDNVDFLALDNADEDADGVKDIEDLCHGTPAGAKVDAHGCPVDGDKDAIPDYRDEELATAKDSVVNDKGIAMTDEEHQDWYDRFYDSTGNGKIVDLNGKKVDKNVDPSKQEKAFTVELARYQGGIPSDEMAYLLSISDVHSFTIGDTTVVYTSGSFKDVRNAIAHRDNYKKEGLNSARVGRMVGENNYVPMTDEELAKELALANGGNPSSPENTTENSGSGKIVYRIQLGAYKNKLSSLVFKHAGKIIEMKTEDGYYRYTSGSYNSISDAAYHKAELVYEGYDDAFITAYQGGKRVPLNKAGATYADKSYKENLTENANTGSAIDKSLVSFKVQLGALKKGDDAQYEGMKIEKQATVSGLIRYTTGNFKNYNDAVKYKNSLIEKGFADAFVISTFKGDVISIQEALELLK